MNYQQGCSHLEEKAVPGQDRRGPSISLKSLQEEYLGNWLWRSVAAVFDVKEQWSIKDLAQIFQASSEEIVEAIEGLELLGILSRTEHGYRKILKHIYFTEEIEEPAKMIQDHVLITQQILGRLSLDRSRQGSFYRTGFVATHKRFVREFLERLDDLVKDLIERSLSQTSEANTVFALSFSGVEVVEKKTE